MRKLKVNSMVLKNDFRLDFICNLRFSSQCDISAAVLNRAPNTSKSFNLAKYIYLQTDSTSRQLGLFNS